MRISERGSAVAEFIFLVLPLLGLAGSTIGVSWYAFSKAQLIQITSEAAMQLAQADSNQEEVKQVVSQKLRERLGATSFSLAGFVEGGVATVNVELSQSELPVPFSLVFPELSAVSHAAAES